VWARPRTIAAPGRIGDLERRQFRCGGLDLLDYTPRDMTAIRTRPETLLQGVLLATVGGFLDAFTYVSYRVFANVQTGNVILFGVDAASARWHQAFLRLAPVAAFLVGVLIVERLGRMRRMRRPLRIALGIEIVGVAVVATLPDRTPELVITVIISLVAAIQFAMFRTLVDTAYTSLATSGNLRSMVIALNRRFLDHDRSAGPQAVRFSAVVAGFAAGAVIGALTTKYWGHAAAAIPAAILVVIFVALVRETRRLERAEAARQSADDI
jgi:uncharacterized membrane protein YoaK (UPF0700 family)